MESSHQLEIASAGLVGKVFSELEESERALFEQINITVSGFDSNVENRLGDLQRTIAGLDETVQSLPFVTGAPYVSKISPSRLIVPHQSDQPFEVAIAGMRLAEREGQMPRLFLGDSACKLVEQYNVRLTFHCSADVARRAARRNAVTTLRLRLEMPLTPSLVERVRGIVDDITHRAILRMLPAEVGVVELSYSWKENYTDSQSHSRSFEHRNNHCEGNQNKRWSVNARRNWRIDTTSVRFAQTRQSSKSTCCQIDNLSEGGFQVIGRVANSGSCGPKIPFSSQRAYNDGRGSIAASVTYNETRTRQRDRDESKRFVLNWSDGDKSLLLPSGVESVVVTFQPFDGAPIRRALIPTPLNSDRCCPCHRAEGFDPAGIAGDPLPGLADGIDDGVVVRPEAVRAAAVSAIRLRNFF